MTPWHLIKYCWKSLFFSLRLIHSNFISRIVLNPIPHGLVLVMIAVVAEYVSGVKIGSAHNHFETFLSKTINYYFQNITFLLLSNFQARKYHSILINFMTMIAILIFC